MACKYPPSPSKQDEAIETAEGSQPTRRSIDEGLMNVLRNADGSVIWCAAPPGLKISDEELARILITPGGTLFTTTGGICNSYTLDALTCPETNELRVDLSLIRVLDPSALRRPVSSEWTEVAEGLDRLRVGEGVDSIGRPVTGPILRAILLQAPNRRNDLGAAEKVIDPGTVTDLSSTVGTMTDPPPPPSSGGSSPLTSLDGPPAAPEMLGPEHSLHALARNLCVTPNGTFFFPHPHGVAVLVGEDTIGKYCDVCQPTETFPIAQWSTSRRLWCKKGDMTFFKDGGTKSITGLRESPCQFPFEDDL